MPLDQTANDWENNWYFANHNDSHVAMNSHIQKNLCSMDSSRQSSWLSSRVWRTFHTIHTIFHWMQGLFWELNPGPLAPEARIMPLDQTANDTTSFLTPNDVEKDNMTVIDASPMICKTFSWFRRKYFQFFAMKLAAKPKALTFWNAKQQIHETTSTTLSTQLLRYALLSNTSYSKHLLASCASLSNP